MAEAAFATYGSLSTLRFATLYGPGDHGNVARLITALQRGRFLWPGPGQNHKSLIYLDDAARACLAAVQSGIGGVYNVSAPAVTMEEIVAAICDALRQPMPRSRIPYVIVRLAESVAARLPALQPLRRRLQTFRQDDVYLSAKFRDHFHWEPKVQTREGIAQQVRYEHIHSFQT